MDVATIGIMTALHFECFAVQSIMENVAEADSGDRSDGCTYFVGDVPSRDPRRPHRVVLSVLTEDGGVAAANGCANMQRSWGVQQIVMCGIACGVPCVEEPARHVRLGDILVASDGVVPYGHVRAQSEGEQIRRPAAKPSRLFADAAGRLRVAEEGGHRPWEELIDARVRSGLAGYRRPLASTDTLFDERSSGTVRHPPMVLSGHRPNQPKVCYGWIGSGGKLIRTSTERNRLARRHRLIGIDMEGDGVSDSAYLQGIGWFMVRGVSDYGDQNKGDGWQRYAALVAAAYVRSLLGCMAPLGVAQAVPDRAVPPAVTQVLGQTTRPRPRIVELAGPDQDRCTAVIDVLLTVRSMADRRGRDAVIARLPVAYQTRLVRADAMYDDVSGLVNSLRWIAGGLLLLLTVLREKEGDSMPVRRLTELLRG